MKEYTVLFIEDIISELPNTKIMIMEPFVLKGTATDNREDQPNRWQKFSTGVYEIAKAAHRVAKKYGLKFIELQKCFDEACDIQEPSYWLADGVHPTAMGHELIKHEWIKSFNQMVCENK